MYIETEKGGIINMDNVEFIKRNNICNFYGVTKCDVYAECANGIMDIVSDADSEKADKVMAAIKSKLMSGTEKLVLFKDLLC